MTIRWPLHLSLIGFSDAHWGSDPDDCSDMTNYCIFPGCSAIAWSSKKQHIVSRSSTEAEYRILANATTEAL